MQGYIVLDCFPPLRITMQHYKDILLANFHLLIATFNGNKYDQ